MVEQSGSDDGPLGRSRFTQQQLSRFHKFLGREIVPQLLKHHVIDYHIPTGLMYDPAFESARLLNWAKAATNVFVGHPELRDRELFHSMLTSEDAYARRIVFDWGRSLVLHKKTMKL